MPGLPQWAADRVEELSRRQAKAVEASGVRVVGDPDRLITPADSLRLDPPEAVELVDVDTAVQALEGLLGRAVTLHDRTESRHAKELQKARRDPRPRGGLVEDLSGRELLGLGLRRAAGRLRRSSRA